MAAATAPASTGAGCRQQKKVKRKKPKKEPNRGITWLKKMDETLVRICLNICP